MSIYCANRYVRVGVHVCVHVSYTRVAKTVVLISVTVAVPNYSPSVPLFKATEHLPCCRIY